jgi:hypothetical protein
MKRYCVSFLIVCLCVPAVVMAQTHRAPTQMQAGDLTSSLVIQIMKLVRIHKNISDMYPGLGANDKFLMTMVSDTGEEAEIEMGDLTDLTSIYGFLEGTSGENIVMQTLFARLRSDVKDFDREIKNINLSLSGLHSPAAVSESEKLRDLIQRVRDRVNEFAPPGAK